MATTNPRKLSPKTIPKIVAFLLASGIGLVLAWQGKVQLYAYGPDESHWTGLLWLLIGLGINLGAPFLFWLSLDQSEREALEDNLED